MKFPNLKIRKYRAWLTAALVFLAAFSLVIFSARSGVATDSRATPPLSGEAIVSRQRALLPTDKSPLAQSWERGGEGESVRTQSDDLSTRGNPKATEQQQPELRPTNLEAYRGTVLDRVQPTTSEKVIALTFDDGPDGKTSLEVLDILEQYNVRATFFLIGENVEQYPYVTRRIASLGHAIGNHTLTHAYRDLNPEIIAEEIEITSNAIAQLTKQRPIFFRPPLGNMDNGLVDYAKAHDYITVLWSINSGDAIGYPGVKTIARNVLESAHSGGIVLLHDAPWYREKTIAALPAIIEGLKAQGYRFVTLPELLTE